MKSLQSVLASSRASTVAWLVALCGGVALGALGVVACNDETSANPATPEAAGQCPERESAKFPLPGVSAEQLKADYWLTQLRSAELDPDAELLSVEAIDRYNRAVGRKPGNDDHTQRDLLLPVDRVELLKSLDERLGYMKGRLDKQQLRDQEGKAIDAPLLARFTSAHLPTTLQPSLRVTTAAVPIRCGPLDAPLTEEGSDPAYDRNACSTTLSQEPIQLLALWPDKLWLVRTRHSLGFITQDAPLSPPVPQTLADAVIHGERVRAEGDVTVAVTTNGAQVTLPAKTTLPLTGSKQDATRSVLVATDTGLFTTSVPSALSPTRRALTRRGVIEAAFQYLDLPYGYGGAAGGYDCSGLLLEVFESFDVALPRHSGWQAKTGEFVVDVAQAQEREKLALLDAAHARGVVLLYFPGHIMLYLGRAADGTPMAIHALGEYARPCSEGAKPKDDSRSDIVMGVRRVVVSSLEVGRDSKRAAFLERITKLVVFGGTPGASLTANSEVRAAATAAITEGMSCEGTPDARIFISPQRPVAGQPLTLIATTSDDRRPARLQVFDDNGVALAHTSQRLGGPPYSEWARVDKPTAGTWTAMIADGDHVVSCRRVSIRATPYAETEAVVEGRPVWQPRWTWERDTENLWSAFVEQLFDDPDPEKTWTNLHTLLRDPARNLLHNHLGLNEDVDSAKSLELVPDCADLPYSLRAYFAWKLSLPYSYRLCSRGRPGRPPTCGLTRTNLMERGASDNDVAAFAVFVNRHVRSGVHSASGRTAPNDEATDLYPVPLNARSLPAGTVYADPYGHVMMLSKWIPQGVGTDNGYGILMATEAQPDGTIGRRRFWRGSFLFEPDTSDVGAGFKAFRPVSYDRVTKEIIALSNADLAKQDQFAPYSTAQYERGMDGFYDSMDALINPRSLDPERLLISLIDALQESAERRVLSVDTGEAYMRDNPGRVIPMPDGHDVFETEGPWEDFSTPSRDMRLLIAIDTVLAVPEQIKRAPERFGLRNDAERDAALAAVASALDRELPARAFSYHRSDNSEQRITLRDVVDRADALEVAYNPNDCPEIRWGAPADSAEMSTCQRRAPAAQQAKLKKYRPWFHDRRRPAR